MPTSLRSSQLEKGTDTEGYFAGQQGPEQPHQYEAKDGTIVAPTHANPDHAPKLAEKKPDIPGYVFEKGEDKKALEDGQILLTPENQKKILLFSLGAIILGVFCACICKKCCAKSKDRQHHQLADEETMR